MRRLLARLAFVALCGLAVIGSTSWWIGRSLPVEHRVTRSRQLAAPNDVVWMTVRDLEATASWRPGVETVALDRSDVDQPRFVEHGRAGSVAYVIEREQPPHLLVTRIVDNEDFGGSWETRIEPAGDGARITITEEGEVYHPLFRFVARFVIGHARTVETYLDALEQHLAARP